MQKMENASKGREEGAMNSLLRSNLLDYKLPPNLSVVTKRSMIRNYFDSSVSATGGNSQITLNAGQQFIDTRNSYLQFNLQATGVTAGTASNCTFANGSATNLIRNVTFFSQSGTEADRCEYLNQYRLTKDPFECSADYCMSAGTNQGYDRKIIPTKDLAADATFSGTDITKYFKPVWAGRTLNGDETKEAGDHVFEIPLWRLGGVFDTYRLVPAYLASGLRVEIQWENIAKAIKPSGSAAEVPTERVIRNLSMVLDSYQLSDQVYRKLNQISASSGLELLLNSYAHSTDEFTGTSINMDSKKAVARAKRVSARFRNIDEAVGGDLLDPISSHQWDLTSWQYNLGGLYFPNQPVSASSAELNAPESFQQALWSYGKSRDCEKSCMVNVGDFTGVDYAPSVYYSTGMNAAVQSLERSDVLSLSGLPINSGRVLKFNATSETGNLKVDMFLEYVKVCRVFLSRVVIRE